MPASIVDVMVIAAPGSAKNAKAERGLDTHQAKGSNQRRFGIGQMPPESALQLDHEATAPNLHS